MRRGRDSLDFFSLLVVVTHSFRGAKLRPSASNDHNSHIGGRIKKPLIREGNAVLIAAVWFQLNAAARNVATALMMGIDLSSAVGISR